MNRLNKASIGSMAIVLAVAMGAVLLIQVAFGSMANYWWYLNGGDLIFTPTNIDIGEVKAGSVVGSPLQLRNVCGDELAVIGFRSGCGCLSCPSLPVVSAGIGVSEISLLLTVPASYPSGGHVQKVRFLASNGEWSDPVSVSYRVLAGP